MTKEQESQLKKLGVFTLAQAQKLGLSQQSLSKLVQKERLMRVGRGFYLHPDAHVDREIGFHVACKIFGPDSAIGGLSALFYYNLVEQVPQEIWVIVPPEKMTIRKGYRLIRTKIRLDRGIISGKGYRIVSIERAILEGLKLATKIGERTAIKAARDAIKNKQTTLVKIGNMAKDLGLDSVLTKYFEAIVA